MRTRHNTDLWGAGFDPLRALLPILRHYSLPPRALLRSYTRLWSNTSRTYTSLPHSVIRIVSQYLTLPPSGPPGPLPEDTMASIWNLVGDIMATHCISGPRTKTYHHPSCPRPNVQKTCRHATLFDVTHKEKHRPKTCASCLYLWAPVIHRAKDLARTLVCTDGSTIPGIRSTAAMAFVEDDICSRELWQTKGTYWPLDRPCNHTAEMSAIDRAIRSPPVELHVHTPTDSMASKKTIERALRNPHSISLLRVAARPYVLSIIRAVRTKKLYGAEVHITHVRSHTGHRDLHSIGNSEADRLCGWLAHQPPNKNDEGLAEAYQMANELRFCLTFTSWVESDQGGPPTELTRTEHGDVRRALRTHLRGLRLKQWASRPKRGELARENPKAVQSVIDRAWNVRPGSLALSLALRSLHQVTHKHLADGAWVPDRCDRCGTGHPTSILGDLQCPANDDIWNGLDDALASAHLGLTPDNDNCTRTDLQASTALVTGAIARLSINPIIGSRTLALPPPPGPLPRPPAVRADKLDDIGPMASLFTATCMRHRAAIAAPTGATVPAVENDPPPVIPPNPHPILPTPLGPAAQILAHRAHSALTQPLDGGTQWQCESLRSISRHHLRTYSELLANPINSLGLDSCRWRSDHKSDDLLGAVVQDPLTFMKDAYTWVCLLPAHDQTPLIHQAVTAVSESNRMARVVALVHDTPMVRGLLAGLCPPTAPRKKGNTLAFVLATAPPGTLTLKALHARRDDDDALLLNTETLAVIVIESFGTPGFVTQDLRTALPQGMIVTPPRPYLRPPPRDGPTLVSNVPSRRHHPSTLPSLCWYRNDLPPAHRVTGMTPPATLGDTTNRLLGALGCLPPKILNDPRADTESTSTSDTRPQRLEKISNIIFSTALEAFRRAENWRKWKWRP
jgi:hypothetical protein